MSESGRSGTRRFVVDTNVFVAAIKPFSKSGHGRASTGTSSLVLLLMLINDDELELFANRWLLDEYKRLGEELSSETSELILGQLTAKMEATELEEKAVARCRPYLPDGEDADVMHAATCLQSRAVLITNDRDFDRIKESGVIEVWSISEAIRKLSIQ
jgi:predicted nucleic acid-binding protein